METARKDKRNAVKNVLLSCVLCFSTGSLYSLGVFTTAIEQASSPPGNLDGVWTSGMALTSLFCTPLMFFTGIYLSEGSEFDAAHQLLTSKSTRARILSGAGSFCYALLGFAGLGVSINSGLLIQLSLIAVGMAMGLFYVESMELLAVWVPHRPGLAVGIGQMMFGVGSIISSSIFKYLTQNYAASDALYLAAAFLSLPGAAVTPFLQWPPLRYQNLSEANESDNYEQNATPISWQQLSFLPSFWSYVISIFCMQVGYVFIAYYFEIGRTFVTDLGTLVASFQASNALGTLLRPMTGALIDILKSKDGFFSIGSKNMIIILYLVQMTCYAALVLASWMNSYVGFAFFAGLILATFAAGSCCAPLLAREQFGNVNCSVVFGAGGSIAMGLGETLAILLMAAVEGAAERTDIPTAYQGFYLMSVLWCLVGLGASMLIKIEYSESVSSADLVESPVSSEMELASPHRHVRSNSYFELMTECSSLGASYGAIDPPLRSVKVR